MDFTYLLGFVIIIVSFYMGNPYMRTHIFTYLDLPSFWITVGGTIATTILTANFKELKTILKVFKIMIIRPKTIDAETTVTILVRIAELGQSQSKQSLVNEAKGVGDGFLEQALTLVGAGLDKEFVQKALETDIAEVERRHGIVINLIRTMGSYAPMWGMLGTVMGVTQVLQNVTDVETIVSGMSLALLTTLYGLMLSAILFIPTANKLKAMSQREILTKEIIMHGVMAIMDKEIPLKVEKYLLAFIPTKSKLKQQKK